MKFKLRIASVALLAMVTMPAWALRLGQIEVKSALNQPLVAAIPLHPENLTELDGLTVGLASADDFARAGLQQTATDQTLRFHVVTDNNGQKLILVTSSQPIIDPYLDFLVQVNTRRGKQLREFVVLLNPVIAAPAPAVQAAPVVRAPAAEPPPSRPAELPVPTPAPQAETPAAPEPGEQSQPQPATETQAPARPQAQPEPSPKTQAQPQPAPPPEAQLEPRTQAQATPKPRVVPSPAPTPPPPAPADQAGQPVPVQRGDTLYSIANDARLGTEASVNQMMLALKSANPEAFFKDNINDLKAGAILRIPTRDEIDNISVAEAAAEVHRQYEQWRAAKPHPATVVEGTAAQAAARTAPQPEAAGPASDHLALVPPTGDDGNGAGNRPGVAGGTGSENVAGLQQQLQTERGALTSLKQSNADLESRVHNLEAIAAKSGKLLSLKDATIAELQRKLAAVQSGQPAATAGSSAMAMPAVANAAHPSQTDAESAAEPVVTPAAGKSPASAVPWFERPLTWIVAGLIVLALILAVLLRRRRRGRETPAAAHGPLPDPEDLSPDTGTAAYVASLQAQLAEDPDNLDTHLALCRLYHAQGNVEAFVAAAHAMHAHVHDPGSMEWHEVAVIGEELVPGDPLFAAPGGAQAAEVHEDQDPHRLGLEAWQQLADGDAVVRKPAASDGDAAQQATAGEAAPEVATGEDAPDAAAEWQTSAAPEELDAADAGIALDVQPDLPAALAPAATPGIATGSQSTPEAVEHPEPEFADDPVDTKLDLARAYLDMGDPVGARAMLDEVLEEGSQVQKDEARRLLVEPTD